jgi:hypothetical protein
VEYLPSRTLYFLSTSVSSWFFKSSVGNSCGILIGVNDSLFKVLDTIELDFLLTLKLQNKNDSFILFYTVVYGPTTAARKKIVFSRTVIVAWFRA